LSIVNIWIEPHVALVGTDSEGVDEKGARLQCSKMFPLVHCNAIIAGRGTAAFICGMVNAINGGDFDEVASKLQALFSVVFERMHTAFTEAGLPLLERQELSLVGYSPRAGKMVNFELTQETRAGGVAASYQQQTIAPWHEDLPDKRSPRTLANMIWLARGQARFLRERAPEGAGGGRLIVAELTRKEMRISSPCTLS